MKPRNVVEFSYDVRAEAIRFFNNVEKYINLITASFKACLVLFGKFPLLSTGRNGRAGISALLPRPALSLPN